MREVIAMLDGYGGLGSFEVEPGNGQNYAGGGAYPDQGGFPTSVSAHGLAEARADEETLRGYMTAYATGSGFVATVEPGGGQNYVGGGAYPGGGFPTSVSAQGLARLPTSGYEMTVEPGGGQNYVGGGAYPGGGFPTSVAAQGLASASGDPVLRVLRLVRECLARYGHSCSAASSSRLRADDVAGRYADYLRDGFGDSALRRRARLLVLKAYTDSLRAAVGNCAGRPWGAVARQVISASAQLTGG